MQPDVPLQLSPDQMRALGYRVVDLLVDHITTLPDQSPSRRTGRETTERLLREALPQTGEDALAVLTRMQEEVFAHTMPLDHPRFFAFVPSPNNFVSIMADALAAGFNVFAGTWLESAGPSQVELVTLDWLCALCGLPEEAGGLFTSGGSAANLIALAAARHVQLGEDVPLDQAVAYCSDQTHSSVVRAMRILGFRPDQLRILPTDEEFQLSLTALTEAVAADRAADRIPFCVIANVGTTNTGAVDPLPELADFCRAEQLWLHADGAYGAAAVFCEEGRRLLRGIDQVDSLVIDPHKWLFQPYEMGCLLVRKREWLRETFHILPEYLLDTVGAADEVNFCDYGLQLTRGARALKLWMSLQVFGAEAFAAAVARGIHLAEVAEAALRSLPNWTVVTSAQMGVLTFQAQPPGYPDDQVDAHNQALVDAILDDGYAMIVSTRLRGRTVLRMCTINPRTTEAEIEETISRLDRLSRGRKQT